MARFISHSVDSPVGGGRNDATAMVWASRLTHSLTNISSLSYPLFPFVDYLFYPLLGAIIDHCKKQRCTEFQLRSCSVSWVYRRQRQRSQDPIQFFSPLLREPREPQAQVLCFQTTPSVLLVLYALSDYSFPLIPVISKSAVEIMPLLEIGPTLDLTADL